jgi:hypothetical protein
VERWQAEPALCRLYLRAAEAEAEPGHRFGQLVVADAAPPEEFAVAAVRLLTQRQKLEHILLTQILPLILPLKSSTKQRGAV